MKRKILALVIAILMFSTLLTPVFAASGDPFALEAPKNLTAELKYDIDGLPYFALKLEIPQSVMDINNNLVDDDLYYAGTSCYPISIQFDFKYGDYNWNEGPSLYWDTSVDIDGFIGDGRVYEYRPYEDIDDAGAVKIEEEVYQFRAYFYSDWGYVDDWIDKRVVSGYSNVVTVGNEAYYSGASEWAKPELDSAAEEGLITPRLKGADMTKPITREEFAELAVVLYEKITKKAVSPVASNPFTDTQNPEILKAFAIGTTKGTSATTFEPNKLINREECATMLYRTIRAMAPDGDYSIEGVPDFPDQKHISSWAVEATKYMSKIQIIKGDSQGNFMPKATTKAQEATGYGMATREAAVLMSYRTAKALEE